MSAIIEHGHNSALLVVGVSLLMKQKAEIDVMTIAERLRAEGEFKGRYAEKIRIAQELLKKKSNIALIAKVTRLTLSEIEKIKKELH